MFEKIIFNLLAFTLFILMFLRLVRKNDTSYVYLLVVQFVGILISFIGLILNIKLNVIIKILMYVLSVVIPILIFILEKKSKINFAEFISMFMSEVYLILKNDKKAEKYLSNTIKKYPNSVKLHEKLAKIYEENGLKEKALEEYETILAEDSQNIDVLIKVGNLYESCDRNKEAKEIFYEVLNQEPENYEASMKLGNVLFEENEYKEAIQIYMAALKYSSADYDLYYNLGMTYTMLNDFQKAKECYETAAKINSDLYHARYTLGQLSLIYGDLEEARKYFEECINSEDVEAGAYFYLARIAIIKGDQERAINYANIAIEDDADLYEKIQSDNMFITIKDKINKPELNIETSKKINVSKKERQIYKHLDHTCKLVGKLNNNDIQMIENVMKTKEQTSEEKENIIRQEEIQKGEIE